MKVAFHTLGCKVNQYETEALKESFKGRGYEIVAESGPADVYVINTCTVTSIADRKSRQYIRRVKKMNPESIIAVTGCYAEVKPEEASDIEGVDIVIGNKSKMNIPDYLETFLKGASPVYANEPIQSVSEYSETGNISAMESKTRAFIKVQDGCNRFCSYCIIPYARGELRSRPLAGIVREAETLIDNGFKEIVLTGINTALYGAEEGFAGSYGVEGVINGLNGLGGDFRLRLSSLEPTVIDAEYVKKLFKYEKLCHHIHLSLQSGSDRVLELMNRKYSINEYMEIVRVLKDFDPGYGISADLIAGFPGESEDDFKKSLEIVQKVNFCKVHVFKYSDRKGTAAAEMSGRIDGKEKSRRSAVLMAEGERAAGRFFKNNLGKQKRVLIEEFVENTGLYTAYTDNYIRVYIKANFDEKRVNFNEFVDVKLTGLYEDGMNAEII